MNLLTIVTITAAILTLLSIFLLLVIILLRVFTDRSLTHESDFRNRVRPVLISFIEGRADLEMTLAILGKEARLALQLLMEVSESISREKVDTLRPLYEAFHYERKALKELKSRHWQTRLHAAEALGYAGNDASIPPLMTALRDEVISVRFAAARSLTRLECNDSVETILHSLDVPGEVSQRRVAEILSVLGDGASESILKVLKIPSASDGVISIAARLAGMLRLHKAVPMLSELLRHDMDNVRLNSVRSLSSINDQSCIGGIASLGEDPSWEVRSSVMQALGRLGASEQIPLLLQGLSDREWWVRHNAGEALFTIGESGITVLRNAVDHHADAYGRDMSRQILQQHGVLESSTEALT